MQTSIVHSTCYSKEGQCLHWVQSTVDSQPTLSFGQQIQSTDPHFQNLPPLNGTCGNPWGTFSDEYSDFIKADCPQIEQPPTHGSRPVTQISFFNSDEELKKELVEDITADCWSVYVRHSQTHCVQKQYCFTPFTPGQSNKVEMGKRESLTDNPEQVLVDLDQGYHVCCSFGCSPFLDSYYVKVSEPNQPVKYMRVGVQCL
jgi:hypothetical protein